MADLGVKARSSRAHYLRNRAAILERHAAWRAANPDKMREYAKRLDAKRREGRPPRPRFASEEERRAYKRAYQRAYERQWREANRDKVNAKARKYRLADPVRYAAINKAYRLRNPLRTKLREANGRFRRCGPNGGITAAEWTSIRAFYGHRCGECGAQGPLTIDHWIPIARGGTNEATNVWPLCRGCNLRKHDRMPTASFPPHVAVCAMGA